MLIQMMYFGVIHVWAMRDGMRLRSGFVRLDVIEMSNRNRDAITAIISNDK